MMKRLLIVLGVAVVVALALMFIPGAADESDSSVSNLEDGETGGVEASDAESLDPGGDGLRLISDGNGGS